jgi:ubiquinone biosynthesis protein UbiJ
MARTPTSEILLTIQAVKQMQADLSTLTKIVESLGERLERLEARLESLRSE